MVTSIMYVAFRFALYFGAMVGAVEYVNYVVKKERNNG